MRAVYLKNLDITDSTIVISDDKAFHLLKVVRVKVGERILVLNGTGVKAYATIISCDKKNVTISIDKKEAIAEKMHLDLLLAAPKKDACADIIKYSCEIGINTIIPLKSEYSQNGLESGERLERLIEAGVIQSNNPYGLRVEDEINFSEIDNVLKSYDHVFYFSSVSNVEAKQTLKQSERVLLIIGPEGGFSPEEESLLINHPQVKTKQFPSWILRSQTAVCVSSGYIFGLLQNN